MNYDYSHENRALWEARGGRTMYWAVLKKYSSVGRHGENTGLGI